MFKRTLEPESMDVREEAIAYLEMDHSSVNKAFTDDLFAAGSVGPRVMELGCGPALIAIEIAKRDSAIELLAIDSSVEMLELAKIEIDFASLLYQVSLAQADAKSMVHFEDEMADTVVSNSLIHHVDDPSKILAEAIRLAKLGGRIFMRDLMRPSSETEVEQLVELHAGSESARGAQLLRQSLHAALTLDEIQSIAEALGIPRSCLCASSDRHWTLDWMRER